MRQRHEVYGCGAPVDFRFLWRDPPRTMTRAQLREKNNRAFAALLKKHDAHMFFTLGDVTNEELDHLFELEVT